MENQRIWHLHSVTFFDAAHTTVAVGLIAPLMKSIFDLVFRYLKHAVGQSYARVSAH